MAEVLINGASASCLVDSGSMVSILCDSFFHSLNPQPELHDISDLCVRGAKDCPVPYTGYAVLTGCIHCLDVKLVSVPVPIVEDTN